MSSFSPVFSQAVKAIEQFGEVIEELLLKHGKRIIGKKNMLPDPEFVSVAHSVGILLHKSNRLFV